MYCKKCGKEIKDTDRFCTGCGNQIGSVIPLGNQIIKPSTNNLGVTKKVVGGICVIIIVFVVGFVYCSISDSAFPENITSSIINIFNFDKKAILGSWKMDTSDFGEGIDYIINLQGKITSITFYSDGTCTVGGSSNSESGYWDIVDGELRVQGSTGGMFWNYKGFISEYELNGDTLIIYINDDSYVYYRQ